MGKKQNQFSRCVGAKGSWLMVTSFWVIVLMLIGVCIFFFPPNKPDKN
jgi:uncharacterized membrane protein